MLHWIPQHVIFSLQRCAEALGQSGAQLALRFTRSAVMLWHHRSNSTASQNASWCCSYQSTRCDTPKRLEYLLTLIWKHKSLQLFFRVSCRHRWKEGARHCSYFISLYRCLSKLEATFFLQNSTLTEEWIILLQLPCSYPWVCGKIYVTRMKNPTIYWRYGIVKCEEEQSLHFQVEEPEDRGKSFFETLVLNVPNLATRRHMPEVRRHSRFYEG